MVLGKLKARFGKNRKSEEIIVEDAIDLSSVDFFQNPYPFYAYLRKHKPVCEVQGGGYLITRHEDVMAILRSDAFGCSPSRFSVLHEKNKEKFVSASLATNILPFMDAPDHVLSRRIIAKTFHAYFKEFQPQLHEIAKSVFNEQITGKSQIDLIYDVGEPYALKVMCDFLGLTGADIQKLKKYCESFFYLFAPIRSQDVLTQVNEDMQAFRSYIMTFVTQAKVSGGKDFISLLLAADRDGEKLTEQQICDNLILLFADGVENIQYAVATVISLLSSQQVESVNAVEEALRLETPAQIIPRIVKEELSLHGVSLKKDMPVFLALASANRDMSIFDQPDDFILDRDRKKALTFGGGAHSCIGGLLGTMQVTALVDEVLNSDFKPVLTQDQLSYKHRFGHRWPETYPMIRS